MPGSAFQRFAAFATRASCSWTSPGRRSPFRRGPRPSPWSSGAARRCRGWHRTCRCSRLWFSAAHTLVSSGRQNATWTGSPGRTCPGSACPRRTRRRTRCCRPGRSSARSRTRGVGASPPSGTGSRSRPSSAGTCRRASTSRLAVIGALERGDHELAALAARLRGGPKSSSVESSNSPRCSAVAPGRPPPDRTDGVVLEAAVLVTDDVGRQAAAAVRDRVERRRLARGPVSGSRCVPYVQ